MGTLQAASYKGGRSHTSSAFAEAKPKHATIHTLLGQCYENVGDRKAAYDQYLMQVKALLMVKQGNSPPSA